MLNIFILENEQDRIDWFNKIFNNHNIYATKDISDACNKVANNKFDLIFLDRDLGNPNENGEDLDELRRKEFEKLLKGDHKRNSFIIENFAISVCTPFMSSEVVDAAFSIPAKLNFKGGRKMILREVGKILKMPEIARIRDKRAMQYSTGIADYLKKLDKNKNV